MKELMIIRHARSLYNVEDTDDLDAGLTNFGHQQARMAGQFLREELGFNYWNVITSPFLRCLETAQHIAEGIESQVNPKVDGRLGEMTVDYHNIDSLYVGNRKEKGFSSYDWSDYNPADFAHERMDAYIQRLEEFWEDVPNRSIVITHGSPVLSFIRMHEGKFGSVPLWNHSVGNCSMTWIRGSRMIWRTRELYWELPDRTYKKCSGQPK